MAVVLSLLGCITLDPIEPDAPCQEVGFAISARTFECTGDDHLANARYEAFTKQYRCLERTVVVPDTGYNPNNPADLFHCAFAIRELACELVTDYGDDLDQYLTASPMCVLVAEPK